MKTKEINLAKIVTMPLKKVNFIRVLRWDTTNTAYIHTRTCITLSTK